jgi:hypothetical protein
MCVIVTGEQGTGKSWLCRWLRELIDPLKQAPLTSLPRDEKALAIDGTQEHLLAYDNVSYLPQWLSDAMCRVATGGGIKSRKLYTDKGQCVFDICNPFVLNGIPDFAHSNDLLGRSIIVRQDPIPASKRVDEATLKERYEKISGGVFGAVLDMLSNGLRNIDKTKIENLPRMADSMRWVTACGDDGFIKAYEQNVKTATALGLEASPVFKLIEEYIGIHGDWVGTKSELLNELRNIGDYGQMSVKGFPVSGQKLGTRLRRDAPAMRELGYYVDLEGRSNGRRVTRIGINP